MNLFTLSAIFLQGLTPTGNVRGTINELLSNWGIPIVALLILLTAIVGALANMELIIDKEHRGTRKEGLINVVYVVLAAALVIAVIGAILAMTGTITLSV